MPIRDEELITYLLGDADQTLRARIENELLFSSSMRERLARLRIMLGHLDSQRGVYEVPSDLLKRTLDFVESHSNREVPNEVSRDQAVKVSMRPVQGLAPAANHRGVWDSVVLSLSIAVLCCIFLPTVLRARFESRRIQCMDNLRYLGAGLIDWAGISSNQRIPAVAVEGPAAFAGVYAIRLNEAGLLESPARLICVSQPRNPVYSYQEPLQLPSMAQIALLSSDEISFFQRVAGGDFAYNLGVVEAGRVMAPRLEGRSRFAILADAPVIREDSELFQAHGGQGLNILFEDGHVEFVTIHGWDQLSLDHPFRNRRGVHDVGVDVDDASLAPSHFAPSHSALPASSVLLVP